MRVDRGGEVQGSRLGGREKRRRSDGVMQRGVEGSWGAAGVPLRHHSTGRVRGDVSLWGRRWGGVLRYLHVQGGGADVMRSRSRGKEGVLEVTEQAAEPWRGKSRELIAVAIALAAVRSGSFGAGL